jgi:hypothetical protein
LARKTSAVPCARAELQSRSSDRFSQLDFDGAPVDDPAMPRRAAGRASCALLVFAFVALRAASGAMAATASIDDEGNIGVDGQPFSPIGIDVEPRSPRALRAPSLSLPATVQLVPSDGGGCWQGTHASGGATKSSSQLFRARNG